MLNLIDTRQGTANAHSYSNGNTLPYTGHPFGMNYFVPQTTNERGSWFFHPQDRIFQGFRLTHQPSPWMGDFQHFLLTPVAGELNMKHPSTFHTGSSYRPEEAIFKPHYLKIKQLRYNITSELTPSIYGAKLRMTYPGTVANGLFFRAQGGLHNLTFNDNRTQLSGYISNFSGCVDPDFKMYFVLHFSQSVTGDGFDLSSENQILLLKFANIDKLEVSLATSFISAKQANLNLSRELALTFDKLKAKTARTWESYLNKIEINHSNSEQVKTFYNCFYRMFLFPQKFYELNADNEPIHYDTKSKAVKKGYLYTNNGFWDTFRTVYPLYSIIMPNEYAEMMQGFLNSFRHTGFLPKWLSPDERGLMPGTLIDGLIADAAVKGIAPELMPEMLEAMIKAATIQSEDANYGRQGTKDYLKYGYVPLDYHESCNHTQDYAYSDFCISQVAKVVGNSEVADFYAKQSLNYRNIFDKDTGFMRAKDKNGGFRPDFSEFSWGLDYAEGGAWQNSFAVYHDFQGLINEYGSKEAFFQKITDLYNTPPTFDVKGYGFEIHEMSEVAAIDFGQSGISNQPSFHIPYLFNYVGQPASSQVVLKQLMTNLFDHGFTGFPGDEDNGSMSGWYVFSSMGFYPVTPGTGEYVLGIPLYDEVKINLPDGKQFVVNAHQNAPHANFVKDVKLNGASHTHLFVKHNDIVAGGQLDFTIGLAPTYREYQQEQLPFSVSNPK
jgi:predicted alpha-1,2-mannosidase